MGDRSCGRVEKLWKRVVPVDGISCSVSGKECLPNHQPVPFFRAPIGRNWAGRRRPTRRGWTGSSALYWAPLRIFLVATFPSLKDQADLLLQDFAEDKILKKGWLQRADRQPRQVPRFPQDQPAQFCAGPPEPGGVQTRRRCRWRNWSRSRPRPDAPSEEFDLTWARTVLARDLAAHGGRLQGPVGRPAAARATSGRCSASGCWSRCSRTTAPPPYEQLIERFGLRSPTDASNLLLSAKRIFKTHLARVIQEYAEQDAATAAEIQALEEFLARLAKRG